MTKIYVILGFLELVAALLEQQTKKTLVQKKQGYENCSVLLHYFY